VNRARGEIGIPLPLPHPPAPLFHFHFKTCMHAAVRERNVMPTIESTYPLSHFHRPGLLAGVCREKGTCARRVPLALVRKPENPIPAIPFGITKSSLRVSDGLSRPFPLPSPPPLPLSFSLLVDSSSGLSSGAPRYSATRRTRCTRRRALLSAPK